jgi:sortase A
MKLKNFLINTFIFLCILAGSVMVGWTWIEEAVVAYVTHVEIEPEDFEANLNYAMDQDIEFDMANISALTWAGALPYLNVEVSPIGEIIIPALDIHLPLLHGTSNENMTLGAGTLFPDREMGADNGNFALGSHHIPWQPGLLFGPLYNVGIDNGELIFLRNSHYLFVYEITTNDLLVDEFQVQVLDQIYGRNMITLVTCNTDMSLRLIVQGDLLGKARMEDVTAYLNGEIEELPFEGEEGMETRLVEGLGESNLAEIFEVVEIEFPTLQVASVGVGSLALSGLVVYLSGLRGRKAKKD